MKRNFMGSTSSKPFWVVRCGQSSPGAWLCKGLISLVASIFISHRMIPDKHIVFQKQGSWDGVILTNMLTMLHALLNRFFAEIYNVLKTSKNIKTTSTPDTKTEKQNCKLWETLPKNLGKSQKNTWNIKQQPAACGSLNLLGISWDLQLRGSSRCFSSFFAVAVGLRAALRAWGCSWWACCWRWSGVKSVLHRIHIVTLNQHYNQYDPWDRSTPFLPSVDGGWRSEEFRRSFHFLNRPMMQWCW